jgi:hypothetical protein
MGDLERIERLEAENTRLRRLALTAGCHLHSNVDMPTTEQLVQLHGMTVNKYPQLACSQDQFERALLALCFARRQKTLNREFFVDHWLGDCTSWLRKHGYDATVTPYAHGAAVIASGILFSDPAAPHFPINVEYGLGRGDIAQPVAGWKNVLKAGRLPEPTLLNRTVPQIESQRMIQPHNPVRDARQSSVRVERS